MTTSTEHLLIKSVNIIMLSNLANGNSLQFNQKPGWMFEYNFCFPYSLSWLLANRNSLPNPPWVTCPPPWYLLPAPPSYDDCLQESSPTLSVSGELKDRGLTELLCFGDDYHKYIDSLSDSSGFGGTGRGSRRVKKRSTRRREVRGEAKITLPPCKNKILWLYLHLQS